MKIKIRISINIVDKVINSKINLLMGDFIMEIILSNLPETLEVDEN